CVLVLWSQHSAASQYVREEAWFGNSRKVLAAARLDGVSLPFGFNTLHTDDLSGWNGGTPPSGINNLLARVDELIGEVSIPPRGKEKDERLRLEQKRTNIEHISVSNHDRDCTAILDQLEDIPDDVRISIQNAYSELNSAQYAARYKLDDRAPAKHYASA